MYCKIIQFLLKENVSIQQFKCKAIKFAIKGVLRLLLNMIGNSNDVFNFRHELLLTNREVANIRKSFAKNSSVNIKNPII